VEGGSLPAMAQAAGIESVTWRTRERLGMTFPRACSALSDHIVLRQPRSGLSAASCGRG
jgi:hypothetical protein